MRQGLFIVLAFLIVIPAFGQRRKKEEGEAVPSYTEGVMYALPRTGVRISVKAVKVNFKPGPYAVYARQLLGIEDAGETPSVRWQMQNVTLESFTEPDPEQVYKAMGEGAFSVSLTQEGCLAGINTEVNVPALMHVETNHYTDPPEKEDGFSFANFNDSPLYTPGDSANNFRPVRIKDEKKAVESASRILECRLTRFHMVAGLMDEFHPDGMAYEVSLKELDRIEQNYLSLFVGRTTYDTVTYRFSMIPSSSTLGNGEVVFRFSEQNGVLPPSDLTGKPVMMKVEPREKLSGKYAELAASENPYAGESGVYYRMPGVGDVSVISDLKTVASARMVLPQFGKTAPIPEYLLMGEYTIKFHPETGAVQSIHPKSP